MLRGDAGRHRPDATLTQAMSLVALLVFTAGAAAAQSTTPARPGDPAGAAALRQPGPVDFKQQPASPEVRHLASWVANTDDNGRMPYLIVDKVNARVFVFDAGGHLQGTAPALLGMARGDGSVRGIGDRELSAIRPADRTTPAGRFVASLDHDVHGKEILVIDYADSISLHPVVKGTPKERRAQRLESATSKDNRISYGCINVPAKFYKSIVSPEFTHTSGVVYILPETRPAREIFGS